METNEEVIVIVQEKRKRSIKEDSGGELRNSSERSWMGRSHSTDDHLEVVVWQREEEGLTPRSLAQAAESLEPLTTPQGVGEEQVGCWVASEVDMLSFEYPWTPQERMSNKHLV